MSVLGSLDLWNGLAVRVNGGVFKTVSQTSLLIQVLKCVPFPLHSHGLRLSLFPRCRPNEASTVYEDQPPLSLYVFQALSMSRFPFLVYVEKAVSFHLIKDDRKKRIGKREGLMTSPSFRPHGCPFAIKISIDSLLVF